MKPLHSINNYTSAGDIVGNVNHGLNSLIKMPQIGLNNVIVPNDIKYLTHLRIWVCILYSNLYGTSKNTWYIKKEYSDHSKFLNWMLRIAKQNPHSLAAHKRMHDSKRVSVKYNLPDHHHDHFQENAISVFWRYFMMASIGRVDGQGLSG